MKDELKKRGRPAKPKPPKKPRGRPTKPLSEAGDRYQLALVQANIDEGAKYGFSERKVTETYAAFIHGRIVLTRENAERIAKGEPFLMWFDERTSKRLGSPPKGWSESPSHKTHRDRTYFRPHADVLRNRLGKIRRSPANSADRRWLAAMSRAWRICLAGDMSLRNHAEALAAMVGERKYFQEVMLPALYTSFSGERNWLRIFDHFHTHQPTQKV